MADKRKNNGAVKGISRGQGRKPKADELVLVEKLKPLDERAFKALENGINNEDFAFLKLFMEYRYGKPKESIEHSGEINSIVKVGYGSNSDEEEDEDD